MTYLIWYLNIEIVFFIFSLGLFVFFCGFWYFNDTKFRKQLELSMEGSSTAETFGIVMGLGFYFAWMSFVWPKTIVDVAEVYIKNLMVALQVDERRNP